MRLHHETVGRFVFLAAPTLELADIPLVCRRTFLRAVDQVCEAGDSPSCQVWLLRLASQEVRRFLTRKPNAAVATAANRQPETEVSGLPDPKNQPLVEVGQQLSRLLDRLAGPCLELAELWFFSKVPEAEVGAALETSGRLISRRLLMCLQRVEALDPESSIVRKDDRTAHPADFFRPDIGHPLGSRLAAYAKARAAQITDPLPVPQATNDAVSHALQLEFGRPPSTPLQAALALGRSHWRLPAIIVGGLALVTVIALRWERAPHTVQLAETPAPSYWSTKSEAPRLFVPEAEPELLFQADAMVGAASSPPPEEPVAAVSHPSQQTIEAPVAAPPPAPPPALAQVTIEPPSPPKTEDAAPPLEAPPHLDTPTVSLSAPPVTAAAPVQPSPPEPAEPAAEPPTVPPPAAQPSVAAQAAIDPPPPVKTAEVVAPSETPPRVDVPPVSVPAPAVTLAAAPAQPSPPTPAPEATAVSTPPEVPDRQPAVATAQPQAPAASPALAAGSPTSRQRLFTRTNPTQYRRNFNSPPMPSVLSAFAVQTSDAGMSLVDADGSRYLVTLHWGLRPTSPSPGRGSGAAAAQGGGASSGALAPAPSLAFEATGIPQTSGESVAFRGWLLPRPTQGTTPPPMIGQTPPPGGLLQVPALADGHFLVRGEVRLGQRTRFSMEARPRDE